MSVSAIGRVVCFDGVHSLHTGFFIIWERVCFLAEHSMHSFIVTDKPHRCLAFISVAQSQKGFEDLCAPLIFLQIPPFSPASLLSKKKPPHQTLIHHGSTSLKAGNEFSLEFRHKYVLIVFLLIFSSCKPSSSPVRSGDVNSISQTSRIYCIILIVYISKRHIPQLQKSGGQVGILHVWQNQRTGIKLAWQDVYWSRCTNRENSKLLISMWAFFFNDDMSCWDSSASFCCLSMIVLMKMSDQQSSSETYKHTCVIKPL